LGKGEENTVFYRRKTKEIEERKNTHPSHLSFKEGGCCFKLAGTVYV